MLSELTDGQMVAGAVGSVAVVLYFGMRSKRRDEARRAGEKDPSALSPFTIVLVLVFLAALVAGMFLNASAGR